MASREYVSPFGYLEVVTPREVVIVPLTGDAAHDAVLKRLAAKGGPVTECHPPAGEDDYDRGD